MVVTRGSWPAATGWQEAGALLEAQDESSFPITWSRVLDEGLEYS